MLSIEQIRKIEEIRKRLEESQPSKEQKIQTLREKIREFEKSESELEQRKRDNSGNSELLEGINRELRNIRETYDDIDEEISHLNRQNPTIDDVFECLDDTIEKVLPILLQIINDHIRTRILDSSDEITVVDMLIEQTTQYSEEWSKLVGMLFQFPRSQDDDGDDYWFFTKPDPILEAQKKEKEKEAKQYMDDILSQLHLIFFQDENRPDFLSDFGIFLTLAITNCDESGFILNNDVDSYDLLSDFVLESSNCDISEIFLEQHFQIIFFKALSHPIIKQYLEENFIPEIKHWSLQETFPRYVSNIESFLFDVEYDSINMKNFPEIVSSLKSICDILEV
jgi:prefoldin subunit 5